MKGDRAFKKCIKHAARKPFEVTDLSKNNHVVPRMEAIKVNVKKTDYGFISKYTVTWTKATYATRYIVSCKKPEAVIG